MSAHPQPSRDAPFAPFVCFSIYAAGLAFNRLYKQVLGRWGLTYPQYLVLVALREADDRSVGELCDLLFLESSTLTPLLKRMEAAGLVERRRDTADERVVRIRLSPQGHAVAADLVCVPGEMIAATDDDSQSLAELPDLIARLDAIADRLRHAANGRST